MALLESRTPAAAVSRAASKALAIPRPSKPMAARRQWSFVATSATAVVATVTAGRQRSCARSEGSEPRASQALHVWGVSARSAASWAEQLAGQCPRAIAWGAGAGAAVTPAGDIVGLSSGGASPCLAGVHARSVAIDGSNTIFFTDDTGGLHCWAPFAGHGGARDPLAATQPKALALPEGCGAAVSVTCGSGHCLALDARGRVYSWATREGGARFGVLGRPSAPPGVNDAAAVAEDVPAPVELDGKGAQCACADARTRTHARTHAHTHTHTHTRTHKHTHALTLSLIPLLSRRPRLKQRQDARKRRRPSKRPLLKQRSQHHILHY